MEICPRETSLNKKLCKTNGHNVILFDICGV